jgi:site-specific DNA-methyltransferase (adenine-specific)
MNINEKNGNSLTPDWQSEDGRIKLFNSDCLKILPEIGNVDAAITDPPYLLSDMGGGGAFGDRKHIVNTKGFTDGGCDHSFLKEFENWFCFCSLKQLAGLIQLAEKRDRWNLITWAKPNPVPTCNNKYLPDVEYIIHGFSKRHLYGEFADKSSFFHEPSKKETNHPNEKPLPLIKKLVNLGTKKEDVICDPFMGSGTTGIACIRTGRRFIGIEISEEYFEIAKNRIKLELQQQLLPL